MSVIAGAAFLFLFLFLPNVYGNHKSNHLVYTPAPVTKTTTSTIQSTLELSYIGCNLQKHLSFFFCYRGVFFFVFFCSADALVWSLPWLYTVLVEIAGRRCHYCLVNMFPSQKSVQYLKSNAMMYMWTRSSIRRLWTKCSRFFSRENNRIRLRSLLI
jgi:hypothetical protein